MKLAILSRAPRCYTTGRLRTAAADRGHTVKVLNTLRFGIDLSGPEPDLQFRGKPLSHYDAILPRIGNSVTYFGTAVVQQFEQMDIRALVVGDRVVAAMRRVAKGDEFRSNVHRGGSVGKVSLEPAFEETAVRAAQIMGLRVAGVDMLEGADGPLVMEVNSSPGLEGIEAATKLDVAGAIIDYIDNQVAFPEIDVRQRLTVSRGYGVAEIVVHAASDLVGRPLAESGLRDKDISVLTLHRGARVIPNPGKGHVLEDGDRLLCFGKLEEMRSMIPARRVKKLPKQPTHEI